MELKISAIYPDRSKKKVVSKEIAGGVKNQNWKKIRDKTKQSKQNKHR